MTELFHLSGMSVERALPVNLSEADRDLFAHELSREIAESTSEVLRNVSVLSNGHLVARVLPLRQSFAHEGSPIVRVRRAAASILHAVRASRAAQVSRGLFVTDEFSNGFFHWCCDVLPRLEALALQTPSVLRDRILVVPAMAGFAYVNATLTCYDIRNAHFMTPRERVGCVDLLVVPPVAPTGNYRPALMESLRGRFRERFRPPAGEARIFISRAKAPRRRIRNEKDLVPTLQRHGFELIAAEDLPFEQQVRRIGAASILAGSHGAGLTHMLWMRPGSCVIELRRRGDRLNNCYFSLASALGLKYFYVLCDGMHPGDTHSTDLEVDERQLELAFARAEAAQG